MPRYPVQARQMHQQADVTTYVQIGSDGTIHNAVITRTGGESLDGGVLEAVRQWKFEPAKCGDTPVEAEAEIDFNFRLEIR